MRTIINNDIRTLHCQVRKEVTGNRWKQYKKKQKYMDKKIE